MRWETFERNRCDFLKKIRWYQRLLFFGVQLIDILKSNRRYWWIKCCSWTGFKRNLEKMKQETWTFSVIGFTCIFRMANRFGCHQQKKQCGGDIPLIPRIHYLQLLDLLSPLSLSFFLSILKPVPSTLKSIRRNKSFKTYRQSIISSQSVQSLVPTIEKRKSQIVLDGNQKPRSYKSI